MSSISERQLQREAWGGREATLALSGAELPLVHAMDLPSQSKLDIAGHVSEIFAERLQVPAQTIVAMSALYEDLALTSLDLLEAMLEDDFGIEFTDGELNAVCTVGDVLTLIEFKVHQTRPMPRLLQDGFVMRHDPAEVETGLANSEGAFLACSFWLADAMVMTGRADEGQRLFDRLLTLRNDLGLLSEEYDVGAQRLVGNFPQAFSHVALIKSAYNLARSSKPAEQRGGEAAVTIENGGRTTRQKTENVEMRSHHRPEPSKSQVPGPRLVGGNSGGSIKGSA